MDRQLPDGVFLSERSPDSYRVAAATESDGILSTGIAVFAGHS